MKAEVQWHGIEPPELTPFERFKWAAAAKALILRTNHPEMTKTERLAEVLKLYPQALPKEKIA